MSLDRSRPPQAGAVRPFRFPDWQSHRLANGLRLLVLPQPEVPLAQIELVLDLGADADPLDRRGLTTLASGLLDEGTVTRSSSEIADQVERLGASFFATGDWEGVYVGASSLSEHADELLELSAEVLRHPVFPAEELERLRAMRLAALANRLNQPGFVAARRALDLVYGAEHAYGVGLAGTSASLQAIDADDLVAWHEERAQPSRATLIAVGDVELEHIATQAERLFADWPAGQPVPTSAPAAPAGMGQRPVAIVDLPDAAQTELRLVSVGPRRSSANYLAFRLVNLIFGGKFTSRLNLNLREEKGITYSVHSRLSGRRGPGPFTVNCAVDNVAVGVAVQEILHELDRLVDEPPSEGEIADAKNYLLGTFPYRVQTLEGLADHLAEIALHDLSDDYYARLPQAISELSADALSNAARHLLDSREIAIVAAGPAATLRPQLEAFGTVEVTLPSDV